MTITLLDTITGQTRSFSKAKCLYYWEEGNGACDCNRELLMNTDHSVSLSGPCKGCHRYLVIECSHPNASLKAMNQDYPADLLAKHGIH